MLCAGLLKNELEGRKGPSMDKTSDAEEKFTSSLEFVLTGAQKRTWEEIRIRSIWKSTYEKIAAR